jgi:hypothetical protein
MRSFWSEPFLWIHLAGLAAVPLCLALCWLGLGVGEAVLPVWLEMLLVAIAGIIPILWMQLARPFNIFSILVVALKPEQLTTQQRQILSLFKRPFNKVLALLAPILLFWVLWQVYRAVPLATSMAQFAPQWHLAGLLLAAIAFLLSNLFLQVPLSVCGVLVTSDSTFSQTEAYPIEKIHRDFTIPGFQVNGIWPFASVPTAPDSQGE